MTDLLDLCKKYNNVIKLLIYLCCSNCVFASADAAYVLAYSVIMLTTDLHSAQVNIVEDLLKYRTDQINVTSGLKESEPENIQYLNFTVEIWYIFYFNMCSGQINLCKTSKCVLIFKFNIFHIIRRIHICLNLLRWLVRWRRMNI